MRIGLVGCVKAKLSHSAPAQELYVSSLFRGRRDFVVRSCDRWFVLSALHGLVTPEQVLEPYDVSLVGASRVVRRGWAERVLRQIDDDIGAVSGFVIELHAGSDYRDFGLCAGLAQRGAELSNPTVGLSQGRQLAFYSAARASVADSGDGFLR